MPDATTDSKIILTNYLTKPILGLKGWQMLRGKAKAQVLIVTMQLLILNLSCKVENISLPNLKDKELLKILLIPWTFQNKNFIVQSI